jgi:hypothetical protein
MIEHRHISTGVRLINKDEIHMYVIGGKGRFILSSPSGVSYEYRVKPMSKTIFDGRKNVPNPRYDEDKLYISVKIDSSFSFLGTIRIEENKYYHSMKSNIREDDKSVKGIKWLLHQFDIEDEFSEKVQFSHMGICGCCGKTLTTEGSIKIGIGPVCFVKFGNIRLKKLLQLKKRMEQRLKKNNITL